MIFDSGLWHKGGPPTQKSRWSIFNYYGPLVDEALLFI